MIQILIAKVIGKTIMRVIEKANDDRIAKSHHKRLKALEKDSHPRADWVCLDCNCKATRKEIPTRRKRKKATK